MRYDYVVVGAGFFGSVFAYEAAKRGKKCLVIEKRNHLGGNAFTEEIEGIQVHRYGAHIFHTNDRAIWEYIQQFCEFNNFINSPLAFYKDESYNLPFNMNTFNKMWGVRTPQDAKDRIRQQIDNLNFEEPRNLEEQALSLVGKDIYEKLIKGYTEKQWGRLCKDLPSFIIKRIPVRFTYDNNYFSDKYQGIPIGGYTQIFEKMLQESDVLLSTDYFDFIRNTSLENAKVIFTGMIDEYYGNTFGKLSYRSLRFETEVLEIDNYQGNAVINYTDGSVPFTRVIEHKHFEKIQSSKTIVTHEFPIPLEKGQEPYYPVNDKANQETYLKYSTLSKQDDQVIFGGRLGTYRYLDMDQVIRDALQLINREFET